MKKIIIISGKQYSGKDTVASILLKKLENYKRIGIGDAIKIEYGSRNNLSFEEIEKNKIKRIQKIETALHYVIEKENIETINLLFIKYLMTKLILMLGFTC